MCIRDRNCPVTVNDVNNAEKIFGPDVGALKGRTTRKNPPVVLQDNIEIPDELMRTDDPLTLCMDAMYVNGAPMLTAIDKTVKYRSLVAL